MIKINNLTKKYKLRKETINILNNINLEIHRGEFVSILGQSGCGKTTLLNIIGGLDRDMEGHIIYENKNMNQYKEKEWVNYRKQKIGYIFQNFNLIPHLTVQENIELAMKFNGKKEKFRKKKALYLLKMVGLKEKAKYKPSQLSGGQKQRVAIARALANEPDMILADEPTGALDTQNSKEIMNILHKINRENGVTIIFVTHNKELAKEADRIVYMKDGMIDQIVENEEKEPIKIDKKESDKTQADKMSLLSAIEEGIKNIIKKKNKNLLLVLGTAVGIMGMMLMLGIGIGAEEKVNYELRSFLGDETIWVTPEDIVNPMNQEDVSKLKGIEGVEYILDNHLFMSTYYYQNESAKGQMDAFGPKEIITEYERTMADFGSIPANDNSYEIVLTGEIAEQLAGKNVEELLGKDITVITRLLLNHRMTYEVEAKFKVVGIRDTGLVAGASFIPYGTANDLANKSCQLERAEQKGAEVRVHAEADYDGVIKEIRDLGYNVSTNKEDFANMSILITAVKIFLIFIAAVALFVASIMIKIVLHTNVVERTKEIGIMSAIGASKKDIKRIFVVEAGILGAISGVIGIVCGSIIGHIINIVVEGKLSDMSFNLYQMDAKTILICMILSVIVTIAAGRKPAKKATKVEPVEALRYE